ncbi:hypothetical protein, conserved [Plasmodium gonderi]|uniref:Uncharacterized protein n=1 Tax=Plasmodium gonderi TaxID=77519 RepID=A0A1Y1JLJ7_PLAGO|nr:hypothetical protein, conserved [Plasmodium gonderi]GAW81682.1 hypothetical protein, conserved [Plasmodium gonderi]
MSINRVKLKHFYCEHFEDDIGASSTTEEKKKDMKRKKKNIKKEANNSRKNRILVLSKGLNIKNVSKLNDSIQSNDETTVRTRNRLRKKIITDSSCDEENRKRDTFEDYGVRDNSNENTKKKFTCFRQQNKCEEPCVDTKVRRNSGRNKVIDTTDESKNSDELSTSEVGEVFPPAENRKQGTVLSICSRMSRGEEAIRKSPIGKSDDYEDSTDNGNAGGKGIYCERNGKKNEMEEEGVTNKLQMECDLSVERNKSKQSEHTNDKVYSSLFSENDSEETSVQENQRDDCVFSIDDAEDEGNDESMSYGKVNKKKERNKKNGVSKIKKKCSKNSGAHSLENSYNENSCDNYDHSSFYVNDYGNSAGETNLSYESGNENYNQFDEYALHLKIFNEQNFGNDMFQFNSISVKKSIRLYIEFTALSLLSPSLKYDANYFKASESVQNIEQSLKVKYSSIHKEFDKKNSLEEYYNNSDESVRVRKKKEKKKKNLKKLCHLVNDSEVSYEKNNRYNKKWDSNKYSVISDEKRKKEKKKKYILTDSSSTTTQTSDVKASSAMSADDQRDVHSKRKFSENPSSAGDVEKEKQGGREGDEDEEEGEEEEDEEEEEEDEEEEEEDEEEEEEDEEEEDEEDDEDEEEDEYEDDDDMIVCDKEGKGKKKRSSKQVKDSVMYKLLNRDMVKIYEFVKKEENFSNYDFLKMICKISKNKPSNYYDRCVQKIEKKILSKRDQFESHPFETNFKNILKNYANIFIYYLEYNKNHCCCCNRKLSYACPVFFIKPFYNSSDLWNNSFFNFMKVNHFEWLGKENFPIFKNPLEKWNKRNEDERKMKNIKQSNKLFIRTQNEKKRKNMLRHSNKNHVDNHSIVMNEEYIVNYLKQNEEMNTFRYIGNIDEKRLKRKKKGFKFNNFECHVKSNECKESNLNSIMKNICEHFSNLSENYIEKDILVLHLGSYCVSTVYYWHVFHHYKFFFTKFIYLRLLDLHKKSKYLFREPLLLAYVLSKKLNNDLYRDFKILMNIDISQIQHKLNECDLFVR